MIPAETAYKTATVASVRLARSTLDDWGGDSGRRSASLTTGHSYEVSATMHVGSGMLDGAPVDALAADTLSEFVAHRVEVGC